MSGTARRVGRTQGLATVCLVGALAAWLAVAPDRVVATEEPSGPPVLAYYYIWFDSGSWERAKSDYPLLGRYSSDDRAVMEAHVRMAKEAGIDGFIVSWKATPTLDRRLAQLVDVAREADFHLAIIYQGLTFEREPLPVDQVGSDLAHLARTYGDEPVFDLFGRPLVIWSGTWEFSPEEIALVAAEVRPALYLLASERSVEGIERLGRGVDGNAYYWSSVNPLTFPDYPGRLASMAAAARAFGGMWIAPAAPGFDARQIGGTSVVPRHDGETLRVQLEAAMASAPDALGLISWNEFSENTHLEPSEVHGYRYLEVVATLTDSEPEWAKLDQSAGPEEDTVVSASAVLAAGLVVVIIAGATGVLLRRARSAPDRRFESRDR